MKHSDPRSARRQAIAICAAGAIALPATLFALTGDFLDVGSNSVGSWSHSAAIGYSNSLSTGGLSLAVGQGNWIPGWEAATLGEYNTVNTWGAALAAGESNDVLGPYSAAIGLDNSVEGQSSAAIGTGLIIDQMDRAVVVGKNNDEAAYSADVAFGVGNGASAGSPDNALIIYKDGTVIVSELQGDLSMGPFGPPGN